MKWIASSVLVAASLFLGAGCDGGTSPASPGPTSMTDEEEITAIVENEMAGFFEEDLRTDEDAGGPTGKTLESIDTDRWVREVTGRSLEVNVEIPGDGTADVEWTAYVEGTLRLVDEIDSVTTTIHEKAFADSVHRFARFRRKPARDPWPPYRRWALESVSFADIVSTPVNTVEIVSLSVENVSTGYTQTFDDPSALLDRETEVPRFSAGDEVEVTVEANGAALEAFLHTRWRRVEMTNRGDGSYTGVYTVPDAAGAHFVAVDLLTEGTLGDDAEAYDGGGWGVTYRVE